MSRSALKRTWNTLDDPEVQARLAEIRCSPHRIQFLTSPNASAPKRPHVDDRAVAVLAASSALKRTFSSLCLSPSPAARGGGASSFASPGAAAAAADVWGGAKENRGNALLLDEEAKECDGGPAAKPLLRTAAAAAAAPVKEQPVAAAAAPAELAPFRDQAPGSPRDEVGGGGGGDDLDPLPKRLRGGDSVARSSEESDEEQPSPFVAPRRDIGVWHCPVRERCVQRRNVRGVQRSSCQRAPRRRATRSRR